MVTSSHPGQQAYLLHNYPTVLGALRNRYEAMQVESNNDEDGGSSRLEVSPRLGQPTPCVKITSTH